MTISGLTFSQKDTLIYFGDPMCSWCYGFSPELDKVREAFPEVAFEIVMGGLRPGGNETIGELRDFLWSHWIEVQQASGQKINFGILDKTEVLYDTEPACRAVILAGKLKPEIKYAYFKTVQEAFFFYNRVPGDADTYVRIAEMYGIDPENFHIQYEDNQAMMDAYSEFDLAASMQIRAFPALVAKIGGKLYKVKDGYGKANEIISLLKMKGIH